MSQFSDEICQLLDELKTAPEGLKFQNADLLLAKNTPESQAALLSILDTLKGNARVYWRVVTGLAAQQALDATDYFENILLQHTSSDNFNLQEIAVHYIDILNTQSIIHILSQAVFYQRPEQLSSMMVSMLIEKCSKAYFYRIILLIREHPNYAIRRTIAKHIVPHFEADTLIPLALGMIYIGIDNIDYDTALSLIWQCIIQGKIDGYEREVVIALQYCMYNLSDPGATAYRCLMEIDVPEAKAALHQWNVDSKLNEMQFFR